MTEYADSTTSPDGLGKWKGGTQKGAPNWVNLKSKSTRTGDWKHTPGKSSHDVIERSADYFNKPTKDYNASAS